MYDWQNLLNTSTRKQISWLSDLDEGEGCWLPLSDNYRVILVEGPDAEKFLQGQCTCDLKQQEAQRYLLGAQCNPQGRMLNSFTLIRMAADKFALRVHQSIAEQTLADLQKYIVFSKASLKLDEEYALLGLYHSGNAEILSEFGVNELEPGEFRIHAGGWILCLGENQYELWFEGHYLEKNRSLFTTEIFCSPHQWDLLNIRRGVAEVRAQTREQLLPQEMNYQLINGVSFKKGCYTGQEVIARIHHKGKLKKHMYRATTDATEAPEPGAAVVLDDKNVGTLILAAPKSPAEYELLVLCKDEASKAKNVQLGTPFRSFLRWQTLPYAIP